MRRNYRVSAVAALYLPNVETSVKNRVGEEIKRAENTSGDSAWKHWVSVATLIAAEIAKSKKIEHLVAKAWIDSQASGLGAIARSAATQATYRNRAAWLAYFLAHSDEDYADLWYRAGIPGVPNRQPKPI